MLFTDNPDIKANIKITIGTGFGDYEFSNLSDKYNIPVKNTEEKHPIQLFYTSGSTGYPKGVILPQSFLFSHIAGFSTFFENPTKKDITIAFADWGWIGALGDVVLPSLYFGIPTVAYKISTKFNLENALEILNLSKASCAFIPPSFLGKLIKEKSFEIQNNNIRAIASGGGTVPNFVYDWGHEYSIEINEFYGQTEANILSSNSSKKRKVGSVGIPLSIHKVEIMDSYGSILPSNSIGEIVVKLPDPVAFLEYLGNPEETDKKTEGGWLHTGDLGMFDKDGFLWFKGRNDYLIKTNAWRVGPEEVENEIIKHKAVKDVAVCGVKDKKFGQRIRAYIVLNKGHEQSSVLENEIVQIVKENLSRYSYPREFVYVKEIPRTESGKIKRNELGCD